MSSPAATGSSGRSREQSPPTSRRSLGAGLPVRLVRNPGRRRPVDRRADLRLAPRRVRDALHAVATVSRLLPAGRRGTESPSGPTTGSGTRWPRDSATGRTAGSCNTGRSPTSRCCRCAVFVSDPDAARPALPRRRRRAHRPADRRQGTEPRCRRRRAALARAGRPAAQDDPRLADGYSDTALRRVWRGTHFSWWMTTMLHVTVRTRSTRNCSSPSCVGSPRSEAGAAGLAENYAGLPIGF